MRILKCVKLDILKSKGIFKFLPLFMALSLVLAFTATDMPMRWGILYMVFGGMVVVSNPFFAATNISEIFVNMLPASVADRVFGRYLFGMLVLAATAVMGIAVELIRMAVSGTYTMEGIGVFTGIVFGVAMIMTSLEFLILYFVKIKNASVLSLVRMVPPFILFFGFSALMETSGDGTWMAELAQWIAGHLTILALAALAAGVLFTAICAAASWFHERMKY